jgi:type IV secretory pathway TraG/TraD family ATPase VirD4
VALTDRAANQHTLVLGTTGSGKTVTICNIVESAIARGIPLIYIDGKGDYDLASRVAQCGQRQGRPVSLFAMKGESVAYNPLAVGGFTSKKDRIIELREWSEEHYKKLAEGYLQSVFKVMELCQIPCNLATLAAHLDLKKLKSLVRDHEASIPHVQALMEELNHQDQASKYIESLVAEIRNFTASEIGPLFRIEPGKPTLTLQQVLAENGIAYFCLPALEFPSMSRTLGRLIVNDLKATVAQQLSSSGSPRKLYVVFDEFSVFAGEQVLNAITMGRSAGIHAVLCTQMPRRGRA